MSLANKALVVSLQISQWTGRKLDKEATGTVETAYATDKRVGNYTKKLLPGAGELQAIGTVAGKIRAFYYKNTLPWCNDGSRILSVHNHLEFVQELGKLKSEFDQAVDDFIKEYPALRDAAKAKLGWLFKESEYPTEASLRNCFSCGVTFMPMPDVQDFRVEILDHEKDEFLKTMASVEQGALKECWNRLYEVVNKACTKLADPEAIFRDSLIENVLETCALLPKLNVTDSPELEAMRKQVEQTLVSVTAQGLRSSVVDRVKVSQELDAITSKMSAFMGG